MDDMLLRIDETDCSTAVTTSECSRLCNVEDAGGGEILAVATLGYKHQLAQKTLRLPSSLGGAWRIILREFAVFIKTHWVHSWLKAPSLRHIPLDRRTCPMTSFDRGHEPLYTAILR